MIVLTVLGRNVTVGQKIMKIPSVLKLIFENVEYFVKIISVWMKIGV
jgi:hypothetical protein